MFFWMFYLHPRKIIRDKDLFQGILVILGHILRSLVFYINGFSLIESYALLLSCMIFSGIYLFGHFSLSHTFTPVIDEKENPNWIRYAFEHTVDIVPNNALVSWIMGYLNCQVVHHLFPSMPQFRQPEVSKRLQKFAKENNIEYKIIGYFEAWNLMLDNLKNVGNKKSI